MDDPRKDQNEFDFQQAHELVAGRQRFQRRAKPAAMLINHLLARKGYGQTESQTDLQTTWQQVVGTKWKNKTMASAIRRGVLDVVVTNSAALQQLNFAKKKLLKGIQEQLPQNKIQNIKFRVGKID